MKGVIVGIVDGANKDEKEGSIDGDKLRSNFDGKALGQNDGILVESEDGDVDGFWKGNFEGVLVGSWIGVSLGANE